MYSVFGAVSIRDQDFNRLSLDFDTRPAKEFLQLRIDLQDDPIIVHDQHGIWSRLEQAEKLLIFKTKIPS